MGKFTDFARTEIYAFHRLTAILTTFFLAAGFTVLAVAGRPLYPQVLWSFIGLVVIGSANILLVWWRLKRTIFRYYAKLESNRTPKEKKVCDKIENNEGKWQQAIWWSFLGCFVAFFVFLTIVLCS